MNHVVKLTLLGALLFPFEPALAEEIEQTFEKTPPIESIILPTELYLKYKNAEGGESEISRKWSQAVPSPLAISTSNFSASFELSSSKNYPLQLVLSNFWESLQDRSLPSVYLPFEFTSKKIEQGKLYICPQVANDQAGCRSQLKKVQVDLGVQTAGLICKLRIETAKELDFQNSAKLMTVYSVPPTGSASFQDVPAMSIVFECSDRGDIRLQGYFIYQARKIPILSHET